MEEKKIIYKEKGSSVKLSFIGTLNAFKATHSNCKIVSIRDAPEWDEDLKIYL